MFLHYKPLIRVKYKARSLQFFFWEVSKSIVMLCWSSEKWRKTGNCRENSSNGYFTHESETKPIYGRAYVIMSCHNVTMSNVQCTMSNFPLSNVQCTISNVQCSMFNVQSPISDHTMYCTMYIQCPMSNVRLTSYTREDESISLGERGSCHFS